MPTNDAVEEQSPKSDAGNARARTQDESVPGAAKDKNIIIINQPRQSSAAWYLLPVFFLIIGGAISYFCLRKQDPPRARKTLIVGAALSVIPIVLLAVISGVVYEEFEGSRVSETDMTDAQIKQSALEVPYASLMEESERYEGEIVHYEGGVVQVVDNFGSYALRVEVYNALFESDTIWSNYDPNTDEDKEWVENLRRTLDPFGDAERVEVWGVFTGLREYETLIRTINTVPEVDVFILEKIP